MIFRTSGADWPHAIIALHAVLQKPGRQVNPYMH